ncbi:uncharacterized protein BX663DRAFT_559893 [Cokeromyces recurvatus]|uniref:uncharacterized protein n=1 Tax=Cokeromyces recurvatus TaxID=90255 RepID=UPI00221E826F|nr:uncharacterized protein BX663DRAFT_559893 [Cokeromyces recurvatus]KAI7904174.1 hypothetical protein BX663DRAFT_559893 [Cokeromyces recurvatus]
MVTPYCKFIPGETRVQAINFELKRRGLSLSHYYNADGILLDKDFDLELVILETTGPFGLKDITRETTDHIKAAYGLLAMSHKIAYCYEYADANIFNKLKVYFIHAADERIRFRAVLPIDHTGTKKKFMDITNMMWELKTSIDHSHELLHENKRSHEKNKQFIEEHLYGYEKIRKLEDLLAESAEVNLFPRVPEAEDIYVFSSPLCPQSPESSQSAQSPYDD